MRVKERKKRNGCKGKQNLEAISKTEGTGKEEEAIVDKKRRKRNKRKMLNEGTIE